GLPAAITIMLELAPLAQSAELQMRRSSEVTTTDTDFGLMFSRHGRLPWETACTVKRGSLPGWEKNCGDETLSGTLPRVQATVVAAARSCLWGRCFGRTELERGDGEGALTAGDSVTCAGVGAAAPVLPPGSPPWPAVELAVSMPFTAQLK